MTGEIILANLSTGEATGADFTGPPEQDVLKTIVVIFHSTDLRFTGSLKTSCGAFCLVLHRFSQN